MNIVVNEELKAYIEPLTPEEHDALERSILTEGCRDALVLWGDVLVDGHNRYGICQKHGLPFQTVQNPRFTSMEDVHLWMIDQHLGRRSVSDFQRGVLALRKREIIADRKARASTAADPAESTAAAVAELTAAAPEAVAALPAPDPLSSREAIAKAARLSSSQVVMIEKIQKQAAPELVQALKAGSISLNAAAVVASLPADEQKVAALAGKNELKLVAKRVRDAARRKPNEADGAEDATAQPLDELTALREKVAALQAENTSLREQVSALRQQLEAAPSA